MASLQEKLLKNLTDKELETELKRRKEKTNAPPTPLDNPDFSNLRDMIIESTEASCKNSYEDEDFKYYIYEAAMEAVYGEGFFDWRNKQKW